MGPLSWLCFSGADCPEGAGCRRLPLLRPCLRSATRTCQKQVSFAQLFGLLPAGESCGLDVGFLTFHP